MPDEATPSVVSPLTAAQWETLRKKILDDQKKHPPSELFGRAASGGSIYRWGLATAMEHNVEDHIKWLSRLAAGVNEKRFRVPKSEAIDHAARFQEGLPGGYGDLLDAAEATLWAAALPGLLRYLPEQEWWSLLGTLQEFRDRQLQRETDGAMALISVAEMGLTLAWQLRSLPSCRRLETSSLKTLRGWTDSDNLAVSEALGHDNRLRLVLASLWRSRRLLQTVPRTKKQSKKQKRDRRELWQSLDQIQSELTTWAAAMTRSGGQQCFSMLPSSVVRDDASADGLLLSAAKLEQASLLPAMKAALGDKSTRGRLAWQVSLPESLLNDEDAGIACLLPEWDVRRGRTVIAYNRPQMALELIAGKTAVISGVCESHLAIDGKTCRPSGQWVTTCEYTDDDVHYLELEQSYEGNVVLQRQVMVLREDRCCLLADAVVESQFPSKQDSNGRPSVAKNGATARKLSYQCRFPLGPSISATPETDTTEWWLGDKRPRALVIPLSANEWRSGLASTHVEATDDQHLLVQSRGEGQLFVPLWCDLSRPRFKSPRTWRQLTVGESLSNVPARLATAYRIQLGRWQWILYRSLAESGPRTFFGKQMIADFYCARFDAESQTYEDLITVEGDLS